MNFYVILTAFLLDRCSKSWAEKNLKLNEYTSAKFGALRFCRINNFGFSGGKLSDKPDLVRKLTSVSMAFAFLYSLFFMKAESKHFKIGFSLVLGGGASNLYDRYKNGSVTDFICFSKGKTLVYNIADFFIFLGCIIMLFSTSKIYKDKRP